MNDFHNGNIKFNELLDEYQSRYLEKPDMQFKPSFHHFIRTRYHGKKFSNTELHYLFSNLYESLGKILSNA